MAAPIHLYAGTAGHSAWFSDDLGESWVHPNSHSGLYLEARVWCFSSHAANPTQLYAGTDMGVFRWDEATSRWSAIASPVVDVWAIAQDPDNAAVLVIGGRPAAFYRSEDAGRTWTACQAPTLAAFSEQNMGPTRVTQIAFDPVVRDRAWATVEIGGIFMSVDRGRSWVRRDVGLISADVHGIAPLKRRDGTLRLLATTNRGLHVSDDIGESWIYRELDSPWQYTRAVVPRADDPAIVFLCNGNGPPGNDGRLLRSRDYGDTWDEVLLGDVLESLTINSTPWCIAAHASDPTLLFLCTNLGQLFRSTNGGDTWTRLEHEFGEVRALHWRPLPAGLQRAPHAITRPMVKRPSVSA